MLPRPRPHNTDIGGGGVCHENPGKIKKEMQYVWFLDSF